MSRIETTIFNMPYEASVRWAQRREALEALRPVEQIDVLQTAELDCKVGDRTLRYIELLTGEYVRITQAELADRPEGFEEPKHYSVFGTTKQLKKRIQQENEAIAAALEILLQDRQLRNEIQNLRCGGFFS